MKNILLLVLYLLLVVSCQDSKRDRLSNMVKEWDGKEIKFPSQSVFTIQGKDTVDFNFSHSTYKILMYVDSLGCISCKLQLAQWKAFMQEVESTQQQNGAVSFIFYFNSKNNKELEHILHREGFVHPVCIDKQDEFNKLNHFPVETNFQTFLLNKENKVIAIGNPIHNPKIKELYLKLLKGEIPTSEKTVLTTTELSSNQVDFGTFLQTQKKSKMVKIKNTGTEPLVIQSVNTSCGCTKVEFVKRPIPMGSEAELNIIYEPDASGHFRKTINIFCNTASSPLQIIVTGKVEEK